MRGFTLNLQYCRGKLKDIKDVSTKPDWCPLKPLPEKMIIPRGARNTDGLEYALSDMRDQHLCFLESSENKDEWQKKYLKEAWACDSGAKALEKQISCKPEEYVPDFPYNIFSTQKCAKCGTPVIGKKISKYCSECGQKIDWGKE